MSTYNLIVLPPEDQKDPKVKKILDEIKKVEKEIEALPRDKYGYAQEGDWPQRQKIRRLINKIEKIQNDRAAESDAVFVTWKEYGFRHIEAVSVVEDRNDYAGEPTTSTTGRAICGNTFWLLDYREGHRLREVYGNSDYVRGTKRPLCGHCRNKWEKLTGVVLA